MTRLTIRIDFGNGTALGPGKIRLLERVAQTGSIRKAAAGMKMSYRRAWLLLKALDGMSGGALTQTVTGGKQGGGTSLTPLGRRIVARYRHLEASAEGAAAADMAALTRMLGKKPRNVSKRSIRKPA